MNAYSGALAGEIRDSLTTGDHKALAPSGLRAVLGFTLIALGTLMPKRRPDTSDDAVWFVVANPVGHGARLCATVSSALKRFPLETISDHSVKDPMIESRVHFPGVGLRSIAGASSVGRIFRAIQVRKTLGAMPAEGGSRFWAEYLFFAQTMRYLAAREAMPSPAKVKLVIADFDRAAYCRPIVHWAKSTGVPVVTLVHGSPAAATYLPILADSVLVWGQCQRDWLNGLAPGLRVHEVGRSDVAFEDRWSGDVDRLVICHSGEILTEMEEQKLTALIQKAHGLRWSVRLRVHPSWRAKTLGQGWDRIQRLGCTASAASRPLEEDLGSRDLVVVVSSSAAVDAVSLGIPVLVLADDDRALACDVREIHRASKPLAEDFIAGEHLNVLFDRLHEVKAVRSKIFTYTGQDAKVRLSAAISALIGPSGAHID